MQESGQCLTKVSDFLYKMFKVQEISMHKNVLCKNHPTLLGNCVRFFTNQAQISKGKYKGYTQVPDTQLS